jgi:hypothetical protein
VEVREAQPAGEAQGNKRFDYGVVGEHRLKGVVSKIQSTQVAFPTESRRNGRQTMMQNNTKIY